MVLAVISELGSLFKIHDRDTVVDSFIFRLHYRWTGSALFVASMIVIASEFVGDPIQCIGGEKNEPVHDAINTFCWIEGTYTLHENAHPDKHNPNFTLYGLGGGKQHEGRTHHYYQWVPAVLFFMGLFFYVPHTVWKVTENKIVDKLLQGVDNSQVVEDHSEKKNNITKYLKETIGLNLNWSFGFVYLFCEGLNLLNVSMQFLILDKFFGGIFLDFGSKAWHHWLSTEQWEFEPLEVAFPRLSKCTFYIFGPSGTLQDKDALCVLAQNIFNEKLFLFIWFWFIILSIITIINLIYEIMMTYYSGWRVRIIEGYTRTEVLSPTIHFVQSLHTGDFCLLVLLARNLDMVSFRDILNNVVQHINNNNAPMATVQNENTKF